MKLGIEDIEVIKTCSQGIYHLEKLAINHTHKSNNEIVSNTDECDERMNREM